MDILLPCLDLLLALVITKLTAFRSAFFHKKSFDGYDEPYVGQVVSFVLAEGPKGTAATKVQQEEGGMANGGTPVEDEGEREMGTVKVCMKGIWLVLDTSSKSRCS